MKKIPFRKRKIYELELIKIDFAKKNLRSGLSHKAVSVYCYLANRADKNGECFPAIRRISGDLNLSKSTIYRAFSELEERGLLERNARYHTQGGQRSSLYKIKGEIGVKKNV